MTFLIKVSELWRRKSVNQNQINPLNFPHIILWNLSRPILKLFMLTPFSCSHVEKKMIKSSATDEEELGLEREKDSINYNYPVIVDVRRTSYSFRPKAEEEESVRHNHSLNYYKASAAFYQHQHIIIIILQHKLTL